MSVPDYRAPFVFRCGRVVAVTSVCLLGDTCVLETLDAQSQTFIEFRVQIQPEAKDSDAVLSYSRSRVEAWLLCNLQTRPLSRGDKAVVIELR